MARYDKYEPLTGGHRAPLNADWLEADLNKVVAVSLNSSGKVVKGTAGQSGFIGVVCLTKVLRADDIVDVMQDGEIVELTGLAAGTQYWAVASGEGVTATQGTTGLSKVGWTVEATRLVVRCQTSPTIVSE
jgi:hypothetical protein